MIKVRMKVDFYCRPEIGGCGRKTSAYVPRDILRKGRIWMEDKLCKECLRNRKRTGEESVLSED